MKVSELRRRLNVDKETSRNQSSTDGLDREEEQKEKWWADLLVFLIVGLATIWLYIDVLAFEAGEGTVKSEIEFLYNIVGKWGVIGFPACIALIKLGSGVVKLLRKLSI